MQCNKPSIVRQSCHLFVIFGCRRVLHQGPDVPGAAGLQRWGPWGCRGSGTPGMLALYLAHTRGRSLSCPWAHCRSHASHSARPPSSPSHSPSRAACPCSGYQQQSVVSACLMGCAGALWGSMLCLHVLYHPITPPHCAVTCIGAHPQEGWPLALLSQWVTTS